MPPGRRGGRLTFFRFAKKSGQRKGDLGVGVPPLRYWQPAVLGAAGVPLQLATFHLAHTIAGPFPPSPALLGAITRVWKSGIREPEAVELTAL
jgi:hypothetical protein